jgi:hypothetical protein
LYGSYLKDFEYNDSEYEVHQVDLKESGSQNFRILAFKGEAVGMTQIYPTTAATARVNNVIYSKIVLKNENYRNFSFIFLDTKPILSFS